MPMSWFEKIENKQKISSRLLVHIHQSRSASARTLHIYYIESFFYSSSFSGICSWNSSKMVWKRWWQWRWWWYLRQQLNLLDDIRFFFFSESVYKCVCVLLCENLLKRLSIYYLPGSFHLEWLVMKHNSTFKMAVKSYRILSHIRLDVCRTHATNTQLTTNCKTTKVKKKRDSVNERWENEWKMGNDNEKFDWFHFLVRVKATHLHRLLRRQQQHHHHQHQQQTEPMY